MNKQKDLFRVGISGSYGGLNLGDEAMLQCMVAEMRQSVPVEITVFSRNPQDTLRVLYLIPFSPSRWEG